MSIKSHWDKVYAVNKLNEVSWYQTTPKISLDFINELNISKNASIIDVGGGGSFLADSLLTAGFNDITVLDISEAAINGA
ncbi:MAG TPA: SAM-dependent methyltransferase, partial [Chitinophagaceae bacterium]|nr:SAM-dependent methyltransferase [Chitinophagaceae bacterium]